MSSIKCLWLRWRLWRAHICTVHLKPKQRDFCYDGGSYWDCAQCDEEYKQGVTKAKIAERKRKADLIDEAKSSRCCNEV